MRILKVFFKNINSLEGETRIDFTEAPFSDTGVFAITGPNGSGKSSILDAITLGLYGETFRFSKPAEYVMTEQTTECFSVIEFSLDGEHYQSGWHVQRAGGQVTGQLQPAVMQLTRLRTGEQLANTPQQVCAKITEITGMNFRNFTRSILLAQGDFAAFLNALDAERMDILEKIISTDIYADYKKQVVDQAEQVKKGLDYTKQKLADISLLPPEKQEAYEHDLIDYQEQYAELGSQQSDLKQQQAAINNISNVQARVNTQKKNLKQAKTDVQNIEQQLERIQASQGALFYKEEIERINDSEQSITQGKKELQTLQSELAQLKTRLGDTVIGDLSAYSVVDQQQSISSLKTQLGQWTANGQSEVTLSRSLEIQIAEKQTTIAVLEEWLNSHAADESLVTHFPEFSKLSDLQMELQDADAQYKKFTKQNKDSVIALNSNTVSLNKEQKKLHDAQQELEADQHELAELMAKHTLEEVDAMRVEQHDRVQAFQELLDIANAHQRIAKSGFGFFSFFGGKKEQSEVNIDELNMTHEELKLEVLREENIKTMLEKTVFYEGLFKKMADNRQYLINGKPCPLCGSQQHPFSKTPPVLNNSKQALMDQEVKIRNLLARTYTVARELEQAKKQSEQKLSTRARRQRLSSHWLSLCNRLNAVSPDMDISNISLMEAMLKAETAELKNMTALATHYRYKQNNIARLTVLIEKTTAAVERLQEAVSSFNTEIEAQIPQQTELETKLQQCQQAEQQMRQQVVNQLAELGEKMPGKKKDEGILYSRLTARKEEYESYLSRHKSLSDEIVQLTEKRIACEEEIKRCKEQMDAIGVRLQNEENISLQLVMVEKQKLVADKERFVAEQATELAGLQQSLLAKIQATAYPTLSALNETLTLIQSRAKLEQQLGQLNNDIEVKILEMEKTSAELEAVFKLAETGLSPEELTIQLKQINEKMDIANLEIQRLQRLLNEQKTLQKNQSILAAQLQQQEAEARPYLEELDLLNAEHGMAFRRRVQQQLANKLLDQTNVILEKISGRYYLRQAHSEQGLALIIEDTLQANVQRLPKTLSGGESFVISLALALGLAELANNGRSVESLFIDEGFGNLDAETLYIIISTLENLHTQGKTVGVISHVEAIQQRFKAQLQVVKKPNGMGMLKKAS